MKKILIFLIGVCLLFTGCKTYYFEYDTSEISTIEIVNIERMDNGGWGYTVLCSIQDKETFLNEFSQIPCYSVAPPGGVEVGEKAIRFLFQNGESEFFNEYGRTMFRYEYEGGEIIRLPGSHHLDESSYTNLIQKYIQLKE